MPDGLDSVLRDQLLVRREQLQSALERPEATLRLRTLLNEVDTALGRMERGTYGLCEECGEAIEPDRLIADPVLRFCLDHLTAVEQQALQRDLEMAARIQRGLLPPVSLDVAPWEFAFHYQPAGIVSGDYCDVVASPSGERYFLLGDVAGKGVSASMLMTQLHALFRSMVPLGLPLGDLVSRASAIFCDSTLPSHYATLVCARTSPTGDVEACTAGHPPLLIVRGSGEVSRADGGGLPIGMFCSAEFPTTAFRLAPGDGFVAYSDGLCEAEGPDEEEYRIDRLEAVCRAHHGGTPADLVAACVRDVVSFHGSPRFVDDVTVMAVRLR
jgi:sigma-B regulation protein RsbU (phosphoserine phosphatase)